MLNRVILIGRLGADPELRATPNGIPVCTMRLAVDRQFRNKQTGERETDWIDVVAWRQQAEFISSYAKKGHMIAVDGSLRTRTWQSQSGDPRKAYEVVADQFQLLTPKSAAGAPAGAPAAAPSAGVGPAAEVPPEPPPQFGEEFADLAADVDLYE